MAIALPQLPRLAKVTPRLIDYGGTLRSSTGGPEQRILRLGSRFAVDVELPPMTEACAAAWIAARLRSVTTGETVVLTMPQTRTPAANAAGAGTANSTVVTAAGLVGQFFSVTAGGRNYLHQMVAAGVAAPRLRASFAGTMEFVAPKLEGWLDGAEHGWTIERLRFVGQSFTIRENR